MLKSLLAPLLTLSLLVGVGAAIYVSVEEQNAIQQQQVIQEVKGVVSSEKEDFFRDPQTIAALAKSPWHLKVTFDKLGSREIADFADLKNKYEFAFPAGVAAAEKIKRTQNGKQSVQPFFTPMVIASWKPIADILLANSVVKLQSENFYTIDMTALFDFLILKNKRWSDLKNSEHYPANKSVLVATSDLRTSNSAAMFLALASYALNNNSVVENEAQVDQLLPKLDSLFSRQGLSESTSELPFQDYLTMGMGKSPLVMIYEAQFLSEAAKPQNSAITADMVLLYPEPTLFTKHIFIPFSANAEKLAEALTNDADLQRIAAQYGLRSTNMAFNKTGMAAKLPNLVNVIDEPSYEILESMIKRITAQ